jgi:hypothetical protein
MRIWCLLLSRWYLLWSTDVYKWRLLLLSNWYVPFPCLKIFFESMALKKRLTLTLLACS